jgi:RimJ/RimL family protein N-acetyltransferase
MTEYRNELGQPIGFPVEGWRERPPPPRSALKGQYCIVEALRPEAHAADLYQAYMQDREHRVWTYLPYGPFHTFEDYRAWLEADCTGEDPLFHVVIDMKTSQPAGIASYLNIKPAVGVIEVGHIHYSPQLQRTPAGTEAMFLMMRRVFDELGYRRCEWKCDVLNARSRRSAERLGFVFEGIFRQATIYKGRNRDTAWYALTDAQWPARKEAFERWLDPSNFDAHGRQRRRLSDYMGRS